MCLHSPGSPLAPHFINSALVSKITKAQGFLLTAEAQAEETISTALYSSYSLSYGSKDPVFSVLDPTPRQAGGAVMGWGGDSAVLGFM